MANYLMPTKKPGLKKWKSKKYNMPIVQKKCAKPIINCDSVVL